MPNYSADNKQTPRNDLLIRFFRNEKDIDAPHSLESIINFSNEEMERYHDFIQWIFPTKEQSMAHPSSPIVDDNFAEELHKDINALHGYCKGCKRYLNYMNFDCDGEGIGNIIDIDSDRHFYLLPQHNFLRITRVLNSLNQTGHRQCSCKLYATMMRKIDDKTKFYVSKTTLDYWSKTQS